MRKQRRNDAPGKGREKEDSGRAEPVPDQETRDPMGVVGFNRAGRMNTCVFLGAK